MRLARKRAHPLRRRLAGLAILADDAAARALRHILKAHIGKRLPLRGVHRIARDGGRHRRVPSLERVAKSRWRIDGWRQSAVLDAVERRIGRRGIAAVQLVGHLVSVTLVVHLQNERSVASHRALEHIGCIAGIEGEAWIGHGRIGAHKLVGSADKRAVSIRCRVGIAAIEVLQVTLHRVGGIGVEGPLGIQDIAVPNEIDPDGGTAGERRPRAVGGRVPAGEVHASPRSGEVQGICCLERHLAVIGKARLGQGVARSAVRVVRQGRLGHGRPPLCVQRDVRLAQLHHAAGIVRGAAAVLLRVPPEEPVAVGRCREGALGDLGEAALRIRAVIRRHLAYAAVRIVGNRAFLVVDVVGVELDIAVNLGVEVEHPVGVVAFGARTRRPSDPLVPFGNARDRRGLVDRRLAVADRILFGQGRAAHVLVIGDLVRGEDPLRVQDHVVGRHGCTIEGELGPRGERRGRVPSRERRAFRNTRVLRTRRRTFALDGRAVLDGRARAHSALIVERDGVRLALEIVARRPGVPDLEEALVFRQVSSDPLETVQGVHVILNLRMHARTPEHEGVVVLEHAGIVVVLIPVTRVVFREVRIGFLDGGRVANLFHAKFQVMQRAAVVDVKERHVLGHRPERSDDRVDRRSGVLGILDPNARSVLRAHRLRRRIPLVGDVRAVIRRDLVRGDVIFLVPALTLRRAAQIDGELRSVKVHVGNGRAVALHRDRLVARLVALVQDVLAVDQEGYVLLDVRRAGERLFLVGRPLVVERGHVIVPRRVPRRIGRLEPHGHAVLRRGRLPFRIQRRVTARRRAKLVGLGALLVREPAGETVARTRRRGGLDGRTPDAHELGLGVRAALGVERHPYTGLDLGVQHDALRTQRHRIHLVDKLLFCVPSRHALVRSERERHIGRDDIAIGP